MTRIDLALILCAVVIISGLTVKRFKWHTIFKEKHKGIYYRLEICSDNKEMIILCSIIMGWAVIFGM